MHNPNMKRWRAALTPLPLLAGLAGCGVVGGQDAPIQTGQLVGGATKQIVDVQPAQGFLPQPELLSAGGARRAALVYADPEANLAGYKNILLDPVVIWVSRDSDLNSVPKAQRQELINNFQGALFKALAQRCHMVRSPVANTMRLRFALTDAKNTNEAVNTVATYTPYVSTAASLASKAFNGGVGYFAGSASAEGYGTDARTGKLLWQAVDKRGGTGAFLQNTLDSWLDVNHAFDDWAERLAMRLQELGVCTG